MDSSPVKRIDVFMPPASVYGVLHDFTVNMYEALLRCGVHARLLEAKRDDPGQFLRVLFEDPPQYTLSFNGLLPDEQGRFFADMIQIPHIACLVDSPNSFLPLVKSQQTVITCVDDASVAFFKGVGFSKAFFLPHAVPQSLVPEPGANRTYDVVMLASCIDYEANHASWKKKYLGPVVEAMETAAERTMQDPNIPYYQSFAEAIDKEMIGHGRIDPDKIDFPAVLDDIEMYIKGKGRVDLVRSIADAKVDLFGSSDKGVGWGHYVGKQKNVVIHDPVPFDQALAIMKHSKIVLNSCPWIAYGGHERVFAGLACGAVVLTSENRFLSEQFVDGESILFYQQGKWDKVNHRVNDYLVNESKRESVASRGSFLVHRFHTWDQRAKTLLQYLI